ncbi:MAG: helix-turn-helix domain-containing protein [Xanthobacteraceae bacterium]|jgi:Cu(I)-responsive transcriptional regulator
MAGDALTIGDLAKATNTKVETVRYYERIGLMPAPKRSASNYRTYDAGHVERLGFIRRSRALGFNLDQVRELLSLADDRSRPCEAIDEIARVHLAEIDRKLTDLKALRHELDALLRQCRHGVIAECQIIKALVSRF